MYDITHLTLSDMTRCGAVLRRLGSSVDSMEGAASGIVQHLSENLVAGATGEPAMVLTRLFKTHPYGELDLELQTFASNTFGGAGLSAETKCLTLMATAGREPSWNTRAGSQGHRTIPLTSEKMVRQVPMMSALVTQLGLEIRTVVKPDPSCLKDMEQRTYNVFHVPEAQGSPYIPAQEDFVVRYGVRSVLGFGGILPSGNLFVIIMFSRVSIPEATANMFKPLALAAKLSVLPFDQAVFV